MKTKVWNGEHWYIDERPILMRLRHWLIRLSGWEHNTGAQRRSEWHFVRWSAVDRKRHVIDPTPISLFGNRLTIQWYGLHWRRRRDYLCWSWRQRRFDRPGKGYAYISHNATPWGAHHWLWGWDKYYRIDEKNGPG